MQRGKRLTVILTIGVSGFALAAVAGLAVAKSFTLHTANDVSVKGKTESIVVNGHGVTVYDLSGETTKHALCTKADGCFAFWFPVTVSSSHAKVAKGPGVSGKVGTWHRNGFFQVTLGGHPLYTFKFDNNKKGNTSGEGIVSFGGTWHVLRASSQKSPNTTPSTTTTTMSTTSTSSTYTYPGY